MPANDRKIVEIIFAEIDNIEERCPGYHKELKDAASDVITVERQNRVSRTNIRQKVEDRINDVGQFLAREREREHSDRGPSQ